MREGRFGPSVLRLVRRDLHRQAGWANLRSGGPSVLGPHECSVTGAKQELGVDERTQERVTRRAVETPKPLRLSRRQSQPGHFDVLTLNPSKNIIEWLLLCCHVTAPTRVLGVGISNGHVDQSNRNASLAKRQSPRSSLPKTGGKSLMGLGYVRASPSLPSFMWVFV